jgi:LysM repeat protein
MVYLGLNVVVSAITVLVVLNVWGRRNGRSPETPTATVDIIAQVASAVPTLSPTIPPSPTPVTYVVQIGDTLLEISRMFGISVEAIMAANGLTNPNALDEGQVLIIPSVDRPVFSEPTAIPTSGTSEVFPTAEPTSLESNVEIFAVEGAGELELETVRLLNRGGEVSMAGWKLDDGKGRVFTFPVFTFYSTGAVDIHTRAGQNSTIDLYWGLAEAVWLPGKLITLRDPSGNVQSTFQIPES